MASDLEPSISCKTLASVDTEHEGSKDHHAVQPSRPTPKERADLETSLASNASTRDLKDSDEGESVRTVFKKELEESTRSFLGDSSNADPPPLASYNHKSGSSTTHDHHTDTERTFRTRNITYNASKELPDRISASLERHTSIVTPELQASSSHSVPEIITDPFLYEKLTESSHNAQSTSVETKSRLENSTTRRNRETSSGDTKTPQVKGDEVANEANNLGNNTKVKVETTLALKNEWDKEKPLDAKVSKPSPKDRHAAIVQVGFAHSNTADEDASPMDCQILAQKLEIDVDFTSVQPTCVALTREKLRCKNKPSESRWKEACAILDYLVSLVPCYDIEKYAEGLKQLACLVLCKHKHQAKATKLVEAWKDSLSCSVYGTNDSHVPSENVQSHTSKPGLEDLSGTSGVLKFSMDFSIDFLGPGKYRAMIRGLVPYQAKVMDKVDTGAFVAAAIERDLLAREMDTDGFIYIYWFPGNFGHIKIGVTGRTVEKRLQEWKNQCGHDPILVYPISEDDKRRVPHVFRVEAIVQAELRKCRRKEKKCKGCHEDHKEWFEQSFSAAITSVRNWSAWMRKEPYAINVAQVWESKHNGYITKSTGVLKDDFKKDLRALCKMMPDAPVHGGSPQHLSPEIRRSRKMSGSRLRSQSEQPRRRSSRIANRNYRPSLVEGENTSLSFSAEFLAVAPTRRSRSEAKRGQ